VVLVVIIHMRVDDSIILASLFQLFIKESCELIGLFSLHHFIFIKFSVSPKLTHYFIYKISLNQLFVDGILCLLL
jgi:hypothetical protein